MKKYCVECYVQKFILANSKKEAEEKLNIDDVKGSKIVPFNIFEVKYRKSPFYVRFIMKIVFSIKGFRKK